METHLSRKKICTAENNNIELNLCKEYILKGLTYKEYKEIIDKFNNTINNITTTNNNIKTTDNNITTTNNNIKTTDNNITTTNNNITTTNNNIKTTDNNITNIECEYCNKSFKYKWCKTRHLKICKIKSDINTTQEIKLIELQNIINKLKIDNNILKTDNNELKDNCDELYIEIKKANKMIIEQQKMISNINSNNTNCNNTTNNNTSNHITINNYITPNIQYLEYNIKKECIYTDYIYFLPILKALFFNKEHPENHSISYSNTRSNKMSVFNGNEWILQNRMDTINDIINNCDDILSEFINDIRNSDNITYKQGKMINLYEKYISNYSLNDDDYKSLHEYIYMESNNLNIKPPIK